MSFKQLSVMLVAHLALAAAASVTNIGLSPTFAAVIIVSMLLNTVVGYADVLRKQKQDKLAQELDEALEDFIKRNKPKSDDIWQKSEKIDTEFPDTVTVGANNVVPEGGITMKEGRGEAITEVNIPRVTFSSAPTPALTPEIVEKLDTLSAALATQSQALDYLVGYVQTITSQPGYVPQNPYNEVRQAR